MTSFPYPPPCFRSGGIAWVVGLACSLLILTAKAQSPAAIIIPVDSPAFAFSPGNWTGDKGRSGSDYRQTWYPGAYFRVTWTTASTAPAADILLDTSTYGLAVKDKPLLTYNIDGIWSAHVPCADTIKVEKLTGAGAHTLTVYLSTSAQSERWGTPETSGLNVVRVTGLRVDAESKPGIASAAGRWALIVGDSITEGSAADFGKSDNLASWSYFVGEGLQSAGYEYGVSACGWSGWLKRGDRPDDVPAYYSVSGSSNGANGKYDDVKSRWNKIDGSSHSLLDRVGHISGFGQTGQEPSLILINYGTNDALGNANPGDLQASVTQCLGALRAAAPRALIFVIVPFGQYAAQTLRSAVAAYQAAHTAERGITIIDLGEGVARGLGANGYWSGLHPNMRGHATFASRILPVVLAGQLSFPNR